MKENRQILQSHINDLPHLAGDIINDDGRRGSSVVHGREAVVSLLPRGVPDLKLHRCVIQGQRL